MRRGRALLPPPSPQTDDAGRTLISRQAVALLTGRHIDVIRRAVEPVACDVATRTLLVDQEEMEKRLAALPSRAKRQT